MSCKFILSLGDCCGVTPCLTPDEPVDDLCAVPAPMGTSVVLLALLRTAVCLEPCGHPQKPLPAPFLRHRYSFFGLLSFLRSESCRMQQKRNQPNKGIILASGSIHGESHKQWLFPAMGWDECLWIRRALSDWPNVPSPVVTTAGSMGGECRTWSN